MNIYQKGTCTFVHDDSLKTNFFAQRALWGTIDLVLTDPPFNIAEQGKVTKSHGKISSNKSAWGGEFQDKFTRREYFSFIKNLCRQSFAVLRDGGSLFCFIDKKFAGLFIAIAESNGFLYKNMVEFIKVNSVPKIRATNFGSASEIGVWLIKPNTGRTPKGNKVSATKPRIFNNIPAQKGTRYENGDLDVKGYHNACSSNVFFGNIGSKRTGHPCEKYSWELEPIIKALSDPVSQSKGGVLDLFAGGFNTGLVCQELGRNYIGFEKDKYFWQTGCDLLEHIINKPGEKIPKDLKIKPRT